MQVNKCFLLNPKLLVTLTLISLTVLLALFVKTLEREPTNLINSFLDCVQYKSQHACLAVISTPESFSYRLDTEGTGKSVCNITTSPYGRVCFTSGYVARQMARHPRIDTATAYAWVRGVTDDPEYLREIELQRAGFTE